MSIDLKPFLQKLYTNGPVQITEKTVDDLVKKLPDYLLTFMGEFRSGYLYTGYEEGEYVFPYEIADILSMQESDVEDYMSAINTLSLTSILMYKDVYVKNNIDWARGGIRSIFNELLERKITEFSFPLTIHYKPNLYSCTITVYLYYQENQLTLETKIKEIDDIKEIQSYDKTTKRYTGYYASVDGSMDAQVVIDKFNLSWNRANVIKYVVRAGKKDPTKEIEDLQKAITYLNFEINRLKEQG